MGDAKVVLTLMNADGELTERFFIEGETHIVQLAHDRFNPFRSEESQVDVGRQLARFCEFQATVASAFPSGSREG